MIIIKKIKRHLKARLLITLLLLLSGVSVVVLAESETAYKNRPLDVRVDRLERLMSSQKQLELLYRMKQLQDENQQLRALLEEQANEIRQIKQQQRQLYTDLERRLNPGGNASSNSVPAVSTIMAPVVEKQSPSSVPVVDKSGFEEAKHGVTEREEIVVSPGVDKQQNKTPVYQKQAMTKQQRKDEKKRYQQAYDELRARRYSKARDSFIALINQYPGGRYAHIAQYWVAESSYAQKNYEQAIIDYQLLLDVYPDSPKKAEAELKKAYSYYETGNKDTARQTLNRLLISYPDTTEAGQARRLLKQL